MLSAVITALVLVVMLLIVANFLIGAWREHRRQKQLLIATSQAKTHPLGGNVTTILPLQEGMVIEGERPRPLSASLSHSWYTRRRTLVSLGFLVMVLLTLFIQDGFVGDTLHSLSSGLDFKFLSYSQAPSIPIQTVSHSVPLTASARLIRVDSASSKQYNNSYQVNVWSYSSCSGIAMEMVMNAYGRHFIAADVLQEELNLGVWDVDQGLLREQGIAQTASYFGFNADLSHTRTLQDVVALANKGTPVIVGVRDSYYFPSGHIFVVRGGDSQYVYIADSSPANFQRMTISTFSNMWQGFSAVLTPRS
jgi:hypothetical protein